MLLNMPRPGSHITRWAAAGIAIAAAILSTGSPRAASRQAAGNRPNIVVVYVDDMGWRDLGVQGSTYYRTPNIDRLATQGMRFTNAYANAPNCAPSRAALLSGQYAPRTGIYTVGSAARGRPEDRKLVPVTNRETLEIGVVTIAEALRDRGYVTGQAGKWHLGGEGHLAADQGFTWSIGGDERGSTPSHFFPYGRSGRPLPGLEAGKEGEYLADRLTDEAIGFIERNRAGPFFLYLSHYGVHTPIQAPAGMAAPYRDRPGAQGPNSPVYAAMVETIDQSVGRLVAALDRLDLAGSTVLIFTSDNGGFGPVTSMAPLRGSKGMIYEGGIREPLIVRWPGTVRPGTVSDVPVIGSDFYPTFLQIAGATAPAGQVLDGRSLLPVLKGDHNPAGRDLFWHVPVYLEADASVSGPWRTTPASAIRRGTYKLVHFFEDDRWELYDLASDISESHDLSTVMPERTAELRAALQAWWTATGAYIPKPKR